MRCIVHCVLDDIVIVIIICLSSDHSLPLSRNENTFSLIAQSSKRARQTTAAVKQHQTMCAWLDEYSFHDMYLRCDKPSGRRIVGQSHTGDVAHVRNDVIKAYYGFLGHGAQCFNSTGSLQTD